MHVLLFRKSSLWGCCKPRHVTKQDVIHKFKTLLYSLIVQPYCTALLYSLIEQPYWTALLYNPIVQPYCTALLNNLIGHPMLLTETCYYLENQVFGGVTIQVLCSTGAPRIS